MAGDYAMSDLIGRLRAEIVRTVSLDMLHHEAANTIERLTAENRHMRDRLDRAIGAAEKHFAAYAIRYKISLFKNGRARNVFPQHMDGQWFAFQRADDDAHIGLSLRCVEAEAEAAELRARVSYLEDVLMRAADEPNIDKARALADAAMAKEAGNA